MEAIISKIPMWLRRPSVLLLIVGLILPNMAFVTLSLIGISVPSRTLPIIIYLLAAASIRFMPSTIVAMMFVGALAFDIMFCATQLFGLTLTEAIFALQFINELDILNSSLYVVLIVALLVVFGLTFYLLLRYAKDLRHASWTPMLLLGVIVIPTDIAVNTPRNSNFWLSVGRDIPFESAMINSGFMKLVEHPNGHHMLVVIVESIGRFSDSKQQSLIEDAIHSPSLDKRYDITEGMSSFLGSTTAAEMREFCATRSSYLDYLNKSKRDCVPFRMAAAGYSTNGYHGFSAEMFEREQWWPHIGFQHQLFGETLQRPGERFCGDVFVGICDPTLVKRIAQQLRAATQPQFLYLLTFNTHIPVLVDQGYKHLDCKDPGGPVPEREVCIMTDAWIELLQTISREWSAPGMPPTEILIVGDHAPPLWYRKARDLFIPGQVPWFRLSPKTP